MTDRQVQPRPPFADPAGAGALLFGAFALLATMLSSCDRNTHLNDPPVDQHTGELRGAVALVANLFTESGEKTGERTVTDADSVRVYLLPPGSGGASGAPIDSTWTIDGAYGFDAPPAGDYRVGIHVGSFAWATSEVFPWSDPSSVVPLLTVRPSGALENTPNPFEGAHGVGLQGIAERPLFLRFEGLSLSGRREFFYEYKAPRGFFHIHMGGDPTKPPLANGPHWAVVRWEATEGWYNLVIAETPQ